MVTRTAAPGASDTTAPVVALTLIQTAAIAITLAVPLIVNPFGPDAYAGLKVQVLYGVTGVILMAWAIGAAVTRPAAWRMTAPELALWTFWLAVLMSSATSAHLRLTVFGAPGRYEGLLTVTAYVALFFVGAQFFGSASGVRRLIRSIGIGAAIVVAYALAQLVLPPLFAGERIIRSWYGSIGLPRINSTLGSPIEFGGYLALVIPLILALVLSSVSRWARGFWLCVAASGYIATLATSTRAAWLAVAVATPMFVALAGRAAWRQHRRALLVTAGAIVAIAAILLIRTGVASSVAERAASALEVQAGSVGQRVYIWGRTLSLIRQRPWFGWGLETLREVFPYERTELVNVFGLRPVIVDKAHNDLLQVAVSVGIPGAAAYAAVWFLVMLSAIRVWRRVEGSGRVLAGGCLVAFVAYSIQAQFSFSTVAVTPLVWLLAGAVAGWEADGEGD